MPRQSERDWMPHDLVEAREWDAVTNTTLMVSFLAADIPAQDDSPVTSTARHMGQFLHFFLAFYLLALGGVLTQKNVNTGLRVGSQTVARSNDPPQN